MSANENARVPSRLRLRVDDLSWDDYSEYGVNGVVRRPFGAGAPITFQLVMVAETLRRAENPRSGLWTRDGATSAFDLVGRIRSVRVARPSSKIPNPIASVLIDAGLPITVNTNSAVVAKLDRRRHHPVFATGPLAAICFRYWWVKPVVPLKGRVDLVETMAEEDTFLEITGVRRARGSPKRQRKPTA